MTKKQKIFYAIVFVVHFLISGVALILIKLLCDEWFDIAYEISIGLILIHALLLPIIGIFIGKLSYKLTRRIIITPILMTISGIVSVSLFLFVMDMRIYALVILSYPFYIAYVAPVMALISSAISKLKEKKASKNA